jgi:LysM repeat protein
MFELQRDVTNLREYLDQQRDDIARLKDEVAALRGEYIIKAGDTLKKIALQIGTTPEHLVEINPGLNGNRLKIGDVININRKKPNEASEAIGAEAAPQPQR